jgi:hypothetical protein
MDARMRNSLAPLILVVVTVCAVTAWLRLSPVADPGIDGPQLMPGIVRLPVDERKLVPAAPLIIDRTPTPSAVVASAEAPAWRTVLVAPAPSGIKGRNPIAASVVLGLAERLVQRGAVAIIALPDTELVPLGADRLITVDCADAPPLRAAGPWAVTVQIDDRVLHLPEGHPAVGRQPVEPAGAGRITVAWAAHADGSPVWSGAYAAVGRHVADAILGQLGCPPRITPSLPRADWGAALHLPPRCDGIVWAGAFQDELVRGWLGAWNGVEADFQKRMTNGQWQADGETVGWQRWRKEFDGAAWVFARRGQDLVCWQERDVPAAQLDGWLAQAGDPAVRARLLRLRSCPALPAEQRARLAGLTAPGEGH